MTANNNPVFNWEVSEKAKKVNQKLIDSKQNGEGYNPAADPKLGFEINCLKNKSGISSVDDTALKHSSIGDFTYNPKTGQVSRMKGGGHGQSNINFLEKNGIEYNIVKEYDNGVRVGNVPKHKTPSKRAGAGQA